VRRSEEIKPETRGRARFESVIISRRTDRRETEGKAEKFIDKTGEEKE
jgi:hypothetical protein